MVVWISGNTGAGKTTLGRQVAGLIKGTLLDGDELRKVWPGLGLSAADRREQNLRAARLAKMLEQQGHNVVVATICPYRDLREQVQEITGCMFIYLTGGHRPDRNHPYEGEIRDRRKE